MGKSRRFCGGRSAYLCRALFRIYPGALADETQGPHKYGGFARAAGEHFEKKWLDQPESLNQDVLMVADFSAMDDLYGVVGNVNDVSALPVSRVDLYGLFAAAFAPAIPVVIGSVPFDVVAQAAVKMLFDKAAGKCVPHASRWTYHSINAGAGLVR